MGNNIIKKIVKKIMPTKKKVEKKEILEEVVVETISQEKGTSFDVFDNNGAFVRTYNTVDHGRDAEELAKGFALKIKGEIK